MKNGELAQLCNGVAALDVEKLCAQFLPTADGTGVKVELRLCGAYLRVGNAENVGRLVRVVIECYACILYAAAKKLPLFGFTKIISSLRSALRPFARLIAAAVSAMVMPPLKSVEFVIDILRCLRRQ